MRWQRIGMGGGCPRRAFVRSIAGLGCAMLLAGCGGPPVPFVNYCASARRTIPDRERVVAALQFVSTSDYDRRLPHFGAFRARNGVGNTATERRWIAERYLASFPNCCRVTEPWVVANYRDVADWLGRNDAFHAFYRANADFRWSNDVLIASMPSNSADADHVVRIQSSDCGTAADLGRG